MPRVNYREVKDRFDTQKVENRFGFCIGSELVSCDVAIPGPGGAYRARVYPWWEHPGFIEALANRETHKWRFDNESIEPMVVSIYPIGAHRLSIGRIWESYGWNFIDDGFEMFEFEERGTIYSNGFMTEQEWQPIGRAIDEKLESRYGYLPDEYRYTDKTEFLKYGRSSYFPIGNFPYSVFQIVRTTLLERNISFSVPHEPKECALPVIFQIGPDLGPHSYDYIIADDFEVEFPEIIHKSEWYVRKSD